MKWSDLKAFKTGGISDQIYYSKEDPAEWDKVLPPHKDWYKAFDLTPFEDVKVVILGQDPYPKKGLAHGLAFSVQPHVKPLPPSLRTILAEYMSDTGHPSPRTGDLSLWSTRGVLLLNTILTVEEGKPLSHKGLGWEKLTYEVIRTLSEKREGLVFMLWGKHAQQYKAAIDLKKHLVLEAGHPSPLNTGRNKFSGCKHFSKANEFLGSRRVDWKLA